MATNATPEQVMSIFPETYAVGAQFGVVLVPAPEETGRKTLRARFPGALASRTRWKWRLSAATSDIPMAAILMKCASAKIRGRMSRGVISRSTACCSIRKAGEVLDYVGGRKDLEAGIIRTIGDPAQRFAEDKLRMLRAVRFAARFEYEIDPADLCRDPDNWLMRFRLCRASGCAMN